jgi:hypothetical protein
VNALLIALAMLALFSLGALLERILPDPTPNPAPYDDQAEYRAAGGAR